jgi:hypothetical protein
LYPVSKSVETRVKAHKFAVVKHAAVLAEWRSTEFTGTATRKIEIDENNVQSAIDKVHLNEAYLVGSSSKKDKKGRQIEVGQV